jgi:hypothetical protein
MIIENDRKTQEGLFEAGPFVGGKVIAPGDIKSYKPESDPVAKKIDLDMYLVESIVKPEKVDMTFVDENACT